MLFVEYPKCTTCKKAKKFLDDHNIKYTDRDIKSENPTARKTSYLGSRRQSSSGL